MPTFIHNRTFVVMASWSYTSFPASMMAMGCLMRGDNRHHVHCIMQFQPEAGALILLCRRCCRYGRIPGQVFPQHQDTSQHCGGAPLKPQLHQLQTSHMSSLSPGSKPHGCVSAERQLVLPIQQVSVAPVHPQH